MKRISPTKGRQPEKIKPVFGRPLEELYTAGGGLPPVFWDTLRLLSLRALTVPGLFRGPAASRSFGRRSPPPASGGSGSEDFASDADSGRKVLLCKRLYDSGQDALKTLPSVTRDMHAVAGVLKLWVASLPEPVVPVALYNDAVATQTAHSSREAQVAALHGLLRRCEHRVLQVLYPLMEFLHHYCLNQANARAERQQLARIFAPLVLRSAGRSVMAQAQDGGMAAQCLEHMIREYRTLFVARKRTIVPPALPTSRPGGTPPGGAAASPVAAAVGAAEAAVILAPEAPSPTGSPRLRINVSSPAKAAEDCMEDLPDSPPSDDSMCADAALEATVSELLFSSTSALFTAAVPPRRAFFAISPESSPESSPTRDGALARDANCDTKMASQEISGGSEESDEDAKSCDSVLPGSPASVPGAWAGMSSDGDSSGGSGDEAMAEAERTRAAAAAFGSGRAFAQHSQTTLQQQASKCARVMAWDTPSSSVAAAAALDAVDFAALESEEDLLRQPSDGPQGLPEVSKSAGLLQAPSDVVQYDAPPAASAAVAQLAAEKAALKRQLRQLDADFEASTGRAPGRAEKEALRPLYVRYWRLKRALQLASVQAQLACATAAAPAAGSTAPAAAAQPPAAMES